jgi:hypothetical protein
MWRYLKKRLNEGSTYAGLGIAIAGLGQAFKVNEAPAIADTVSNVGQAIAAGQVEPVAGVIMGIAGLAAALWKDKN